MSDALDVAYASVLTRFTQHAGNHGILLDNQTGLAAQLRDALDQRIQEAMDPKRDFDITERELVNYRLERDTWTLLQTLTNQRVSRQPRGPTAQETLNSNPFAPLFALIQRLVNHSDILRELACVLEWVHTTAPTPESLEAHKGYWTYTRLRIVHNKRFEGARNNSSGNVVTEIDPDAMNRSPGSVLDPPDESYERSLTQVIYAYVRAGKLEDAMELCRNVDHPWRSALLQGSMPFAWSLFDTPDGSLDPDEAMDVVSTTMPSGNRRRRLWKEACATAARATSMSVQMRAMYAALAPQRGLLPVLLMQCKTWEDHLWAYISVIMEERLDAQLGELKGSFWLNGLDAIRKQEGDDGMEDVLVQDEISWRQDVLNEMDNLKTIPVEQGPAAESTYHSVQLQAIRGNLSECVEHFAANHMPGEHFQQSPRSERHRVVRFFAHICLFHRYLHLEISPRASLVILETYISYLEASSKTDLVALYASCLGSAAIDRFASFLAALPPQISNAERLAGLRRAEEHGLDAIQVACSVAEQTANRAFRELPGLRIPLPAAVDLTAPRGMPSDAELLLLTSVEWLVFEDQTLPRALVQVNHIIRYFLGMGNIPAAQVALTKVPGDIANQSIVQTFGVEHRHYQWLLEIWRMFEEVGRFSAEEPLEGTTVKDREYRSAWARDYAARVEALRQKTISLFENRWLLPLDDEPVDSRQGELNVVRQIYIPELIIRLHVVLMDSRRIIPRNVRLALELANVVADSRHSLAEEFYSGQTNRLSDYLAMVRTAAIEGMALGNCADPFRIVTST